MINTRDLGGALLACVAALSAACGSVTPLQPDAGPADASIDAPDLPPIDAPNDAPTDAPDVPTAAPAAPQLTSAGGRLRGATYTLDVQVGHAWSQTPADGDTFHLVSRPAIAP